MSASRIASIALDFIDQIADLEHEQTIRELLLRHSRRLGFDRLCVAYLPHPLRPPEIHLCAWPDGFYEHYMRRLFRFDPILEHCRQTIEPFDWSEVTFDRSKRSRAQWFMNEIAAFGFESGFVVPIVSVEGEQSVIGLAGQRTRLGHLHRRGLHLMCVYAHHAVRMSRMNMMEREPISLAPIERDFLAYVVGGVDADGIRDRLRLTEYELARISASAMRTLEVRSVAEAAAKAALLKTLSL